MTTIREGKIGEAAAIAALVNVAYEVERFFVSGDRTSPDHVRAEMKAGPFLVAVTPADKVIACVHVETDSDCGAFGMLAVHPAEQRRGWGRRLIDAAEEYARAAGCQAMEIRVVNLRTDLIPRYERLGYAETGAIEPYDHRPTIQDCHFVVMRKALG